MTREQQEHERGFNLCFENNLHVAESTEEEDTDNQEENKSQGAERADRDIKQSEHQRLDIKLYN